MGRFHKATPPVPAVQGAGTTGPSVLFARGVQNTLGRHRERVYGFAMKFEPIDTGEYETEVTFECVNADWYHKHAYRQDVEQFWQDLPAPPAARVTLRVGPATGKSRGLPKATVDASQHAPQSFVGLIAEGSWYLLTLSLENPPRPPVTTYEALNNGGDYEPALEMSLMRLELPQDSVANDLVERYRIRGGGVEPQAMQDSQEVAFVGVLNVGQGGCNALYGTDRRPFLYYDFGRSKGADSRPDSIKPCLASAPQIVLSHWDQDHYELARSYPEARHLPWLAMPEKPGPTIGGFFRSLTHVRLWPYERYHFEEYAWGFILRADGTPHTNNCGLVMLVRVRDDTQAPPLGQRRALDVDGTRPQIFPDERYVLMTGDAMFQFIPSCRHHDLDGKIIGINAAHHGAYDDMLDNEQFIPLAAAPIDHYPATVAYTYGFNRGTGASPFDYGHPCQEAVNAYKFRGYHLRLNTNPPPAGDPAHWAPQNVVLGWRRGATPVPAGAAAAAIAAARWQYDQALVPLPAAIAESQATLQLMFAARQACAPRQATAAQVVAAVQARLVGVTVANPIPHLAPGLAARLAPELAVAHAQATGVLAVERIEAMDERVYNLAEAALDVAGGHARTLAQTVAQHDPAYPAPQHVHCQGAAVAAQLHPLSMPVTFPGPRAATAVAPNPGQPVRAVQVTETALLPTRVLHPAHGLATGDQVIIAGASHAAANAQHVVTRVSNDEYTIAVNRGGMPVSEYARAERPVAAGAPVRCNIVASGVTATLVRHNGHVLLPGHPVTITAGLVAYTGPVVAVDDDNYAMQLPAMPPGRAVASGRRAAENFKERCHVNDPGTAPTIVNHPNHRLATNDRIDIQRRPRMANAGPKQHCGPFYLTVVDANHYSIPVTCGQAQQQYMHVSGVRTNVAFQDESVERSSGNLFSTVQCANHGLATGNIVALANSTHPALVNEHHISWISADTFQIDVGTGDGQVHQADVTRLPGRFVNAPVTLLDPGQASIVRDVDHGLATGAAVTIAHTAHFDGNYVIRVLTKDTYAIPFATGAARVEPGSACAHNAFVEPVLTLDNGVHTTIMHRNHGLPPGAQVAIAAGLHAGNHSIAPIDAHSYAIAHTTNATQIESAINVNGVPIRIVANGSGAARVTHLNHGLAHGGLATIVDAMHPGLAGNYLIGLVDANCYDIAVPATIWTETHRAIMASGHRTSTGAAAPASGVVPPSEASVRHTVFNDLAVGNAGLKIWTSAAFARRRQQMQQAGACAGTNCAFVDLRRT